MEVEVLPAEKSASSSKKSIIIKVIIGLIMLGFGAVIIWLFTKPHYIKAGLEWIRDQGYWGNLILILCFGIISLPFAFTGYTVLALACGFLYRMLEGELTALIGANVVGAALSYWICATLAKSWVERQISSRKQLQIFLKTVQHHGFKIAFLFRLTPIPYGIQNAVFAVSGLSFKTFMLATLGLLPEQIMWVYFGSTARRLTDVVTKHVTLGPLQIGLMVMEVAIIIGLIVVLAYFARRSLRKAVEEEKKGRRTRTFGRGSRTSSRTRSGKIFKY